MGYAIDSTFDLTRVLRIPGTLNYKYDPPRECRVIRDSVDLRYNPADLESVIEPADMIEATTRANGGVGTSPKPSPVAGAPVAPRPPAPAVADANATSESRGRLVYDPAAKIDVDLFEALSANDPKFTKTWDRKRKDLKDQSPSGYDMALAHIAIQAGLTDQDILNLCIAWRRKHGEALKLDRPDYWERYTIAHARAAYDRKAVIERLHSNVDPSPDSTPGATEDSRADALDVVSKLIGVRVRHVFRYTQDPPKFRLVTNNGEIELGGVENLIGQAAFRNAVASMERKLIPTFKAPDWQAVAQNLLNACEDVDTGDESTDKGMAKGWIGRYLDENPPGDLSDQAIANQTPYFKSDTPGRVFIFGAAFREWLGRRELEKISGKQLGIYLRKIGGEPKSESYKGSDGQSPTTRSVWQLPAPARWSVSPSRVEAAAGGNGKA
jgi:hypothetical protein